MLYCSEIKEVCGTPHKLIKHEDEMLFPSRLMGQSEI